MKMKTRKGLVTFSILRRDLDHRILKFTVLSFMKMFSLENGFWDGRDGSSTVVEFVKSIGLMRSQSTTQ